MQVRDKFKDSHSSIQHIAETLDELVKDVAFDQRLAEHIVERLAPASSYTSTKLKELHILDERSAVTLSWHNAWGSGGGIEMSAHITYWWMEADTVSHSTKYFTYRDRYNDKRDNWRVEYSRLELIPSEGAGRITLNAFAARYPDTPTLLEFDRGK